MEIQYKKLTEKELDTFIQMRINQLKEEGATEEIDLGPALRDYYDRHMCPGWPKMVKKLLVPAECHSRKNHRISDVRPGK